MSRTARTRTLALTGAVLVAAVVSCAPPAAATDHSPTTTRAWYLPAGVDPHAAPLRDWFPQTVAANPCSWQQVDTYWYGAWAKPIVDALDDDGLLTFEGGQPEDASVYKSHRFIPPAKDCTKPEPTPTPSTPEPTPTATATPTATPSSSPTPSATASPSPAPSSTSSPTSSPSVTVTPTTPETASSTTSPSPARPRLVQTDTPELAATGPSDVGGLFALGVALLAAGVAFVLTAAQRARRH